MHRHLSCLTLLLVLSGCWTSEPTNHHVDVPVDCQVANIDQGYCLWCSLETSCRHQHIKAGYDMVLSRFADEEDEVDGEVIPRNLGTRFALVKKLDSLNIEYVISGKDNGLDVIREGLSKDRTVVIGVTSGEPTCDGYHAILLTAFNEKDGTYDYIDSNLPWCEHRGTMKWFDSVWDGFAIYLK